MDSTSRGDFAERNTALPLPLLKLHPYCSHRSAFDQQHPCPPPPVEAPTAPTRDYKAHSHLLHLQEEAVYKITRAVGVQAGLVGLGHLLHQRPQLLKVGKYLVVWSRQIIHDVGENVVHLERASRDGMQRQPKGEGGVEGNQANPYWEAGTKDTKIHTHNPTLLLQLPSFPWAVRAAASGSSANPGGPLPSSALDPGERIRDGGAGVSLSS